MNIAEASVRYKVVSLVFTAVLFFGGLKAYTQLGRLEDPEFTIKSAQVITRYPGASAMEVAEEVTDRIETAVQQLGQIDEVNSNSKAGLSIVTVDIKDRYDKHTLPQVWDELRRKVNDVQKDLPPGAGPSIVNDDFGDVYGILYAVYGDGYSYAELKNHVDLLRRELLLVQDVGKVATFGELPEAIYLEFSNTRMAQFGVSPHMLFKTLEGQNKIVPAGQIEVGSSYLRVQPSGAVNSVEDIANLLILQADGRPSKVFIRDVAKVFRDYVDPPNMIVRFNGRHAIGLGISTVSGGNVVTMGEAIKQRLRELEEQTPIGIELGVVSMQSDAVTTSINGFVVSLMQAVAIVIGVLIFAMGLRSALLIGGVLLLTVLGTFIVMKSQGVMLERISLGALIIALGMLVDNAIVVVEGILVNSQKGMSKVEAAGAIVKQTMWPLFGATLVAILAFAAIGASQDSTGEYCRSLFLVIMYSLTLSWILAITITPLFGDMFLKVDTSKGGDKDPYGGRFFRLYERFLTICLRRRWGTLIVLVAMLFASVFGFGFVKQSFFPPSTRPQLMVHFWLPQGRHIKSTEAEIKRLEDMLLEEEGVGDVAMFIGQGAPRFLLTYTAEEPNTAYAIGLVWLDDPESIEAKIPNFANVIADNFPNAQSFVRKFMLGPGDPNKIQLRLRGPDPDILRILARETKNVLHADPNVVDIVDDWRQRVPMVRPVVADVQARNAGVTRAQIANTLQGSISGMTVGQYREEDLLIPIISRNQGNARRDVQALRSLNIWSPVAGGMIPLSQVVLGFESTSENTIVRRLNRVPTITVMCDPKVGEAVPTFQRIRPLVEQRYNELEKEMGLTGYSLEWGGEYENSKDAQAGLASMLPMVFLSMVFIVICLFNSIKQPAIIFLTVPLALIGVTVGLLLTGQPFGFMALLGFLSLIGMMIKNAIVLIDEINLQLSMGKDAFRAIIDSGLSRLRPVSMAALTTVLGMIPLLPDAFFASMAVTIMFGLTFATVLTLIVVPVLFACFYRVPNP